MLKSEEEFLNRKIMQINASIFVIIDIQEIDNYIGKMESLISDYFCLSVKLKCSFSVKYKEFYKSKFKQCTYEMNQDIKMVKILKQKVFLEGKETNN